MFKNIVKEANISDFFDYYKFVRYQFPDTAIHESNCDFNIETGKYSIMGIIADSKIMEKEGKYYQHFYKEKKTIEANWLDVVDEWYGNSNNDDNSVFAPGAIGYIGYEEKNTFENLLKILKKDHDVPSVYLVHYKLIMVNDKQTNAKYWCYTDDGWMDYEKTIFELEDNCRKWKNSNLNAFHVLGDMEHDFTESEYYDKINQTINHIKCGDIFQANITMRIHGRYVGDPFLLYCRIRSNLNNPFFAYYDFPHPLISTSPERFFKIEGRIIETNPIKGTIKTTKDGIDQGNALKNSVKNRAENTMITDLMRNDIGRICKKDTVEVTALCELKRFNEIYHLESVIKGELKENIPLSAVLKAVMPGGSITGAPKIKAMDIIEQLENTVRGPYTGMLTFFNNNGFLDSSIGIRIIYFDREKLYIHSGGGIVIRSTPESEYKELLLKIDSLKKLTDETNILKNLRENIEDIDSQLFYLLNHRFKVVNEVAELKEKYNIPVLQKNRVQFLKQKGKQIEGNYKELPEGFSYRLYDFLINESMKKKEKIMEKKRSTQNSFKLNVAASLDENFPELVSSFPEVKVLFGKMKSDCIGGGVESKLLKDISYDEFVQYIKKVKRLGMNFNYVINAPTMGNDEFTADGRAKLDNLLVLLNQLDLEAVTVSNPFLIQYIKKKYSNIPVKASSIMMIDSVQKAQFVKNSGADIIVLDSLLVNRDFASLRRIRDEISGEIEIMLNNNCLMNCPMLMYHQTYLANNSRENRKQIDTDYCYLNCSRQRIENPVNLIRSEWIRPEDIHYYEEIGYDCFKITDRSTPTDILLKRIKAYTERSYDGNLLDLIIHYGYEDNVSQNEYYQNVYINNKALDGFLEYFYKEKCDGRNCTKSCRHCFHYADKSIKINEDFRNKVVGLKKDSLNRLI